MFSQHLHHGETTDDDFRYCGFRLAVRLTDGTLLVRRNPLGEDNRRWAEFEAFLGDLDGGAEEAHERRLDTDAFHAVVDEHRRAQGTWDGLPSAKEDPPRDVVASFRAAPTPVIKDEHGGIGDYVRYRHRLAARTPAGDLVVRQNPLPPEHPL